MTHSESCCSSSIPNLTSHYTSLCSMASYTCSIGNTDNAPGFIWYLIGYPNLLEYHQIAPETAITVTELLMALTTKLAGFSTSCK